MQKPEVSTIVKESFTVSFQNWAVLLGAIILSQILPMGLMIVGAAMSGLMELTSGRVNPVGAAIAGLCALPLILLFPGFLKICMMAADNMRPTIKELVTPLPLMMSVIVATAMFYIAVGIGILMLFVPGIFLFVKLQLAPFYIIDMGLGPTEALKASWKATEGVFVEMFLIDLIFTILASVLGFIGPVVNCIFFVAIALAYRQRVAAMQGNWQ